MDELLDEFVLELLDELLDEFEFESLTEGAGGGGGGGGAVTVGAGTVNGGTVDGGTVVATVVAGSRASPGWTTDSGIDETFARSVVRPERVDRDRGGHPERAEAGRKRLPLPGLGGVVVCHGRHRRVER